MAARRTRRSMVLGATALLLLAWGARGQEPEPSPAEPELSIAVVESRIAALPGVGLDEAARATAHERLQRALEALRQGEEAEAQAREFERLTAEAPTVEESIKAELSRPPEEPKPEVPAGATLAQLEQGLTQARSDLTAARERVEELRREGEKRKERRAALAEQLTRLEQQAAALDERERGQVPADEPAEVSWARRAAGAAERRLLLAQRRAAQAEVTSYERRASLLPLRRDRAARRAAQAERLVEAWQRLVTQRRQEEATQAQEESQRLLRDVARQAPAVQGVAEASAAMATELSQVSEQLRATGDELTATRDLNTRLRERLRSIKRKIAAAGLTNAMAFVLRKEFERRPELEQIQRRNDRRQEAISDVDYRLVVLQEEREEVGDVEAELERVMAQLAPLHALEELETMRPVVREVLLARRDQLDKVIAAYQRQFEQLVELDTVERGVLNSGARLEGYIEERILWVRSVQGSWLPGPAATVEAARWLLSPVEWRETLRITGAYYTQRWGEALLFLGLLLLLFAGRRWALLRLAQPAGRLSLARTLRGLALNLLIVAILPALFLILSLVAGSPAGQTQLGVAVSAGLLAVATQLGGALFLLRLVRPRGLGEAEFHWPAEATATIRRNLAWYVPVRSVADFVVYALDNQPEFSWGDSLGRICWVVGGLSALVLIWRVFRPASPVLADHYRRNPQGMLFRLRWVWFGGLMLGVGSLVGLAVRGYYYTVIRLGDRLQVTFLLVLALVLVHAVLRRWLLIARRRLQREQAAKSKSELRPGEGEAEPSDEELDLIALRDQTMKLFRALVFLAALAGFYGVWSEVLPALKRLEQIQVWPPVVSVEPGLEDEPAAPAGGAGQAPGASGGEAPANGGNGVPALVPQAPTESPAALLESMKLDLMDILQAVLAFLFTGIAARNLPGLLEIALLQRLDLDAGARYAVITLVRYVIVLFGVTLGLAKLGIGWGSVQWLAAALTFGLAFGLQEIFANFISGLIILFERPVRVGDVVTIGAVTGKVARIRIRATTIVDWDRKELIIPNKEFVTGEVINWTLTDSILRVNIPIGLAYGTDPARASALLHEVARAHKDVLTDPPPQCVFVGFGDSALNFELRVFVPHIDYLVNTRHELLAGMQQALAREGIQIPFPQRDLHLRTPLPLPAPAATAPTAPAEPAEPAPPPAPPNPPVPAPAAEDPGAALADDSAPTRAGAG